jgi:enoyl-CoA hydratase/carnithine racemase
MTYTCFKLDVLTPSLWRTTFNNPPINLIDVRMVAELRELFVRIERNEGPAVLIFESADPDYFLAHFDIASRASQGGDACHPGPADIADRSRCPLDGHQRPGFRAQSQRLPLHAYVREACIGTNSH